MFCSVKYYSAGSSYFFSQALGLNQVPSAATHRQRMDKHAERFVPLLEKAPVDFLTSINATITPLDTGHVALDADVTPMDNSRTKNKAFPKPIMGVMVTPPWLAISVAKGIVWQWSFAKAPSIAKKIRHSF